MVSLDHRIITSSYHCITSLLYPYIIASLSHSIIESYGHCIIESLHHCIIAPFLYRPSYPSGHWHLSTYDTGGPFPLISAVSITTSSIQPAPSVTYVPRILIAWMLARMAMKAFGLSSGVQPNLGSSCSLDCMLYYYVVLCCTIL